MQAGGRSGPRHGAREPVFNIPLVVLAIALTCVAIHLVRLYVLTLDEDIGLILRAAFIPIRYSGLYELDIYAFTTPFTYAFLHGGVGHLAINMVWLFAFGSPLATRLGAGRFLLFWAVTALAAAALHYALHPLDQAPLIGASGAISGMMGAAARFGFRVGRMDGRPCFIGPPLPMSEIFRSRGVIVFLGIWMAVNVVTGLAGVGAGESASIAWEAHIGGFVAGFFGIRLFLPR